jgi:predicted kinase
LREPFLDYIENKLGTGFLLIACGLPGTWKTETTEEVASNMEKRTSVYDEMFRQADEVLNQSEGVVLDATFVAQSLRQRAAEIAARHDQRFIILQTDCPQEVSIRRILNRTKENYESNALTEQAYLNNKERFEPVDLDDLKEPLPNLAITHLVVDTTHDPPEDWYITRVNSK